MLKNPEIFQNMFNRIGYKSIGDILGRIILMDIPFLEDYNASNRMLFPVRLNCLILTHSFLFFPEPAKKTVGSIAAEIRRQRKS